MSYVPLSDEFVDEDGDLLEIEEVIYGNYFESPGKVASEPETPSRVSSYQRPVPATSRYETGLPSPFRDAPRITDGPARGTAEWRFAKETEDFARDQRVRFKTLRERYRRDLQRAVADERSRMWSTPEFKHQPPHVRAMSENNAAPSLSPPSPPVVVANPNVCYWCGSQLGVRRFPLAAAGKIENAFVCGARCSQRPSG